MGSPSTDAHENVQRASKLNTTSISDALDRLGIAGQCLNIKPLDHRFRLTGRAFTILYGPAGRPAGTVGMVVERMREPKEIDHLRWFCEGCGALRSSRNLSTSPACSSIRNRPVSWSWTTAAARMRPYGATS